MKGYRVLYDFIIYEGVRETTFRQEDILNEKEYQDYLKEVSTNETDANNGIFLYKVSAKTVEIKTEEIEDITNLNFKCNICGKTVKKIVHSLNEKKKISVCHECGTTSVNMQNSIASIKLADVPINTFDI